MTTSLEQLAEDHLNFARWVARRNAGAIPPDHMDDVIGAAYLGLWEGLLRYKPGPASLTSYLYFPILSRVKRHTRWFFKKWVEERNSLDFPVRDKTGEVTPLEELIASPEINPDTRMVVREVLDKYPELRLSVEGYTQQEISEQTGLPLSTIQYRIGNSRSELQNALQGKLEPRIWPPDKETLKSLLFKGYTRREIATMFGVSPPELNRLTKKYGLQNKDLIPEGYVTGNRAIEGGDARLPTILAEEGLVEGIVNIGGRRYASPEAWRKALGEYRG